MKAPDSRSGGIAPAGRPAPYRVVRDPAAAELLMNPTTLRQLAPFLGEARSVTEAAADSGDLPNTVLKRVERFLAAGLLQVAETVPRRGRPIKRYRTSADLFFVPFEVTAAESLEASLAERDAYWERLLRRNVVRARMEALGTWGTRVYRDARGRLQVQTAVTPEANATTLDAGAPAVLSSWRDSVMLDFEDAKALQREMFELLMRYEQKRGAQRYIVRLGLAPVLDP
ncbi:MAG: ArsR family transcriptional regulator [Deinococcales bacterium]